ncbi:aminoglycoside phosphotransferase family protein [Nocardiopsis changdeensis]|uniref:aminoglycoside phosphotransferase family protein n=1 Tax=Nocardiopsis changdeensis TaxID=2831969 RepID=UPI003F467F64
MNDVTTQFVDDRQRRRLERRFGVHVGEWLAGLPAVVDELATEWRLTVEGAAPHGRTSVVLHVLGADGRRGVVKLSPDSGLAVAEAGLLRLWEPTGRVPQVWGLDPRHGAVFMERVEGDTVAARGEVPEMETVGALIADLHAAEVSRERRQELPPLTSRVQFVFDLWERERSEGPAGEVVPASVMHRARALARDLANGREGGVPLHGDLHPGNVIDGGERGLVALDPRGCLGDGAVDAVDWAMWKAGDSGEVERRVSVLSRVMDVDTERMMLWVRAFAPCLAVSKINRGHLGADEFDLLMGLAAGDPAPAR